MKIKETLITQSFSVSDPDPYLLSLKTMEELSKNTKVVERKNTYKTDGPHHSSTVSFDAIELIDDFSKIVFHFSLVGDGGLLWVDVNGLLSTNIDETGFFSGVFSDFYVDKVFPLLRKLSQDRVDFFSEKIDALFGKIIA